MCPETWCEDKDEADSNTKFGLTLDVIFDENGGCECNNGPTHQNSKFVLF